LGKPPIYRASNLPSRLFGVRPVEETNVSKTKLSGDDRRLARLSKICLALPEATRRDMGRHASFLVRKKTFAYFMNDHHGDGIVSVACKALPGENVVLAGVQPDRFYLPSYIGPRGWVALRLDIGKTDWQEVRELVTVSYCLIAPRRLALSVKLRS
jgi:predicted DNA-binding protein (MmcQ/YjbR family)